MFSGRPRKKSRTSPIDDSTVGTVVASAYQQKLSKILQNFDERKPAPMLKLKKFDPLPPKKMDMLEPYAKKEDHKEAQNTTMPKEAKMQFKIPKKTSTSQTVSPQKSHQVLESTYLELSSRNNQPCHTQQAQQPNVHQQNASYMYYPTGSYYQGAAPQAVYYGKCCKCYLSRT